MQNCQPYAGKLSHLKVTQLVQQRIFENHGRQSGRISRAVYIAFVIVGGFLAVVGMLVWDYPEGVRALISKDESQPDQGGIRQRVRTSVAALGRLEPESEVIDISGPAGTRLVNLFVREGDRVSAGDHLAHLDGYAQRLAGKERAEVLLKEGQELHAAETMNGEAAIEEALLRLNQIDTLMPLEIKTQRAVVKRIEGDLDNARRSLDRLKKLRQRENVSEQVVDDQNATVLRLEEELAQARFSLARLEASREIERLLAAQKLRGAKSALERAQVGTRIQSLAADLALAEAELERLVVRAPISGVILKVLTWPGERIGDEAIVKLGNTDQMYAVAEVYETDVHLVDTGMRATVTSPALKGILAGTVERISPLIFKNDVIDIDPASRVDARVVEVRIKLDDSSSVSGLSNLQVHVNIDLFRKAEQG